MSPQFKNVYVHIHMYIYICIFIYGEKVDTQIIHWRNEDISVRLTPVVYSCLSGVQQFPMHQEWPGSLHQSWEGIWGNGGKDRSFFTLTSMFGCLSRRK